MKEVTPAILAKYAKWLAGLFPDKPRNIRSLARHEITGRGTVYVVNTLDGPFASGDPVVIDGLRWTVVTIEMTAPIGPQVGLVVRPRTK